MRVFEILNDCLQMNTAFLKDLLRAKPLEPFAINLSNGQWFEVRHPELLMVGRYAAAVGVPSNEEPDVYDRLVQVSMRHIASIEPLRTSGKQTPENGA